MLKGFLENRRAKKAVKEWNKSPLGQALARHTREYFYEGKILSHYEEENKNRIIDDFYQQIFSIAQAENPFLQMRELVASYVIGYAAYQVLCLKESEKEEAFYSDCPYISGELHKHIQSVTEHNDELGELKWKYPEVTNDELVSFCNSRCALHLYYLNGMNLVRSEYKDLDTEKDWLQPFTKSMLIWEEDQIRNKIGLPSLLPDSMDGLKHSTFMNMVTNGHKNPYYEWEKSWAEDEIV
ncbi:hypothetical protein ACMXYQ_08960 [Neptuniibacter sp. PT34_22]|uniref:hypothetical protein n=1 Tax=Neptuniibacter sp. PT34_22 TaxID=3398205 RepID=UPI0039F5A361